VIFCMGICLGCENPMNGIIKKDISALIIIS
jgi:hypothetical protein